MQAVILKPNIPVLYRALLQLSKVHNDVHLLIGTSATRQTLSLYSSHPSQSLFAIVTLGPAFFESFECLDVVQTGGRTAYRVLAKALLSLLKVKSLVDTHERLTLTLNPASNTMEEMDRLVVRLDCVSGITKVHRLFYTPVQPRLALYSKSEATHSMSLSSSLAHRLVQVFGKSAEEVCLDVKRDEWALTGMSEAPDGSQRALVTRAALPPTELESYHVPSPVSLVVSLKSLKMALLLTDAVSSACTNQMNETSPIHLFFTHPGRPLIMSLSHGDPGNGESAVDIVLSTSMLEGSLSGAGVVTRGIGLGGLSGSPIEILQQSTQALPRRQQQQSDEEDERVAGSPRVTRVRGLFD